MSSEDLGRLVSSHGARRNPDESDGARNLLDSIKLLASAPRLLAEKCVEGIEANCEQAERYAEVTLSATTALNPNIGYDKASEIVKEGGELREAAAGGRTRGMGRGRRAGSGVRLPRHEAARASERLLAYGCGLMMGHGPANPQQSPLLPRRPCLPGHRKTRGGIRGCSVAKRLRWIRDYGHVDRLQERRENRHDRHVDEVPQGARSPCE